MPKAQVIAHSIVTTNSIFMAIYLLSNYAKYNYYNKYALGWLSPEACIWSKIVHNGLDSTIKCQFEIQPSNKTLLLKSITVFKGGTYSSIIKKQVYLGYILLLTSLPDYQVKL